MASVETGDLECDPHPAIIIDSQAVDNEHGDITMAALETKAFESDPYVLAEVGFVDVQATGKDSDDGLLASRKTELSELDSGVMALVDVISMQAGGNENNKSLIQSGEVEAFHCDSYASGSTVGLRGNKHNDNIVVSAERKDMDDSNAVTVKAGMSQHDGTMVASVETETLGGKAYAKAEVDLGLSVEDLSCETQNVHKEATVLVPGDDEVSVTPIQHREQEDTAATQSSELVSNHEGSFSLACPAGETVGDGTFEHVPIDNQVEIQGEEPVFDISEFDLGAHDVPITGTFFGEHCIFPALDADKAEAWHGPEDDVILEDRNFEHVRDQHGMRDALPMGTSSDTVSSHHFVEKLTIEGQLVLNMPLQMSSKAVMVDAVHELKESSIMQDTIAQDHEKNGHQFNEALGEHAEVLAPVLPKGVELPSKDIKDPVAQEIHVQGGEGAIFVSFSEQNMEVVQPQTGSSEDRFKTCSTVDDDDSEVNLSSMVHKDKAVHSLKFYQDMHGGSAVPGVESIDTLENEEELHLNIHQGTAVGSSTNTVTNEGEMHLNIQDTVVGSRIEIVKSNEGSVTQAVENAESDCMDSQSKEISAPEQFVEIEKGALLNERDFNSFAKSPCTDSHSKEITAPEESMKVEKGALLNERDFNSFAEASCTAAIAESVSVHANRILSNEIKMEAVVPVVKLVVQEERVTSTKNPTHDKDSEVGPGVSYMEVDKLHLEQAEKQVSDPLLMGVKPFGGSDRKNLDTRQSDGEGTLKDRGDVNANNCVGPEQGKEEQEELRLKVPINTPLEAEKQVDDPLLMGIKPFGGSDCKNLDTRQSDGEGTVKDRDDVIMNPCVGSEQEELCLKLPIDTPLEANIAEEAQKQDLPAGITIHTSSSSGLKSSRSDFPPANELPESLKNDEKPAILSLEPGEENKGEGSLVKKQLKKHVDDCKSPLQKGGSKLDSSILEVNDSGKDASNDECSSEPDEELSGKELHKPHKEGNAFGIGDLVWAKVRSHPWWPAQIFDPADASKSARKAKKSGKVLVAFFGDCTFAWLQQSQMIAFGPNFKEKVKQTTLRIFCIAVEEALEEICRRSELGLSCVHFKGSLHSTSSFPDANTGIREGVKVPKWHKDMCSSVQMFRPDKTLEFVKGVACSPLGSWCSTLKFAELRGYAYGLRTCMVASAGLDTASLLSTSAVPAHGSKLERSNSSFETNGDADAGNDNKKAKKMKGKRDFDGKGFSQISKKAKKGVRGVQGTDVESKLVATKTVNVSTGNKDSLTIKFKVSKKARRDGLSSSQGLPDTAPGQAIVGEKSSDDGRETLLALAGSSIKALKRSSSKQDKSSSTSKKKALEKVVGKLENHTDSEAAASPRTDYYAEDAYVVTSSLSEEKGSNAEVKIRKSKKKSVNASWSPVSSIDAEDMQEEAQETKHSKLAKVVSRDETKETVKEVEMKKELETSKKRKFSKVGDSILRVASELTGTPVAKSTDDNLPKSTGLRSTIKVNDSELKLQGSPMSKKAASKESAEDVSLLQLRQDLELLANQIGGGSGKTVKRSKKGYQVDTGTGNMPLQWQNATHKTQKSHVQELTLAARKRKFEMVHDEVSAKLPKNTPTTRSQGHDASTAYIKGAEKPAEHRSSDKNLSHYSRRPALPASNVKGSSHRYDEKLSSHMPLGLFMKFPEDFPLPSESQLKAAFVPFGPLQMSATRLFHDSASAQVVFKRGRDAESAMRHAKKNAMFGPVAVTYRLRYLSNSSKVESKTDSPSHSKFNSSSPVKKVEAANTSPANRAGNTEVGTAVMMMSGNDAVNSGSKPTGDIQDKMMTLLRQVSVLVKPSPVGLDGT